ncbi:MAG TPA: TIGR00730 family Rossman fold protein, partial [Burkholderiaceae bacterium]|nr:TIGR00730 family Rossman fold protein [Burkholderiaceae bacterium]
AARRTLRQARERADALGGAHAPAQHLREVAIAERIEAKSRYYEVARELGQRIAQSGNGPEDTRVMVMTGGGPGIMEAANRGAFDVGAMSIGLNIALTHEQYPNPYITPELCLRFHYFALRKLHFVLRARALVAFPGGYGTFDELFETLTLIQTRKINPVPVVLVGESYWRRAFDVDFLVDEGVIAAEDRALFWYAETAVQIWESILQWHQSNGTPLYPPSPNAAPRAMPR